MAPQSTVVSSHKRGATISQPQISRMTTRGLWCKTGRPQFVRGHNANKTSSILENQTKNQTIKPESEGSFFVHRFQIFDAGRRWPTRPSERQLPTGSFTQNAVEANWEAETEPKYALLHCDDKLGFLSPRLSRISRVFLFVCVCALACALVLS